jgi:hypothetical protein
MHNEIVIHATDKPKQLGNKHIVFRVFRRFSFDELFSDTEICISGGLLI